MLMLSISIERVGLFGEGEMGGEYDGNGEGGWQWGVFGDGGGG